MSAVAVAIAFSAAACGSSSSGGSPSSGSSSAASSLPAYCGGHSGSGKVLVGAANFAENITLADIYVDALKACGYDASSKTFQSREAYYPLLKKGKIQAIPEYAASLATFIGATASGDINATIASLKSKLPSSLAVLDPSAATDRNAFAVKTSLATANNLKTLSDLAAYSKSHPLTLAGPAECPHRPYCEPGLKKTYGLNIAHFQQTDADGPLTRKALTSGKADLGLVFSSDADLPGLGLTVLTDDKQLQSSDNIVPVVASSLSMGAAASALNAISAAIDQTTLVDLNKAVIVDKGTSEQVAQQFVAQSLKGSGSSSAASGAPLVTSVSPSSGPTTGGTSITVTGKNFTGATAVKFGAAGKSVPFTVVSDTQITVKSPAHAAGQQNIFVTTPAGTSMARTADRFTYGS